MSTCDEILQLLRQHLEESIKQQRGTFSKSFMLMLGGTTLSAKPAIDNVSKVAAFAPGSLGSHGSNESFPSGPVV
jgi:hypothetical protein